MSPTHKKQCHAIIHSHAVAAATGNAVPIPGLGIAADMVAMTSMTMSLCAIFGGDIKEEAAKTLAIATLKNTMLKQPIRVISKELSKLIPGLGQVVAPSITVLMLEAAGWILAQELEQAYTEKKFRLHSKSGELAEDFVLASNTPSASKGSSAGEVATVELAAALEGQKASKRSIRNTRKTSPKAG